MWTHRGRSDLAEKLYSQHLQILTLTELLILIKTLNHRHQTPLLVAVNNVHGDQGDVAGNVKITVVTHNLVTLIAVRVGIEMLPSPIRLQARS